MREVEKEREISSRVISHACIRVCAPAPHFMRRASSVLARPLTPPSLAPRSTPIVDTLFPRFVDTRTYRFRGATMVPLRPVPCSDVFRGYVPRVARRRSDFSSGITISRRTDESRVSFASVPAGLARTFCPFSIRRINIADEFEEPPNNHGRRTCCCST